MWGKRWRNSSQFGRVSQLLGVVLNVAEAMLLNLVDGAYDIKAMNCEDDLVVFYMIWLFEVVTKYLLRSTFPLVEPSPNLLKLVSSPLDLDMLLLLMRVPQLHLFLWKNLELLQLPHYAVLPCPTPNKALLAALIAALVASSQSRISFFMFVFIPFWSMIIHQQQLMLPFSLTLLTQKKFRSFLTFTELCQNLRSHLGPDITIACMHATM